MRGVWACFSRRCCVSRSARHRAAPSVSPCKRSWRAPSAAAATFLETASILVEPFWGSLFRFSSSCRTSAARRTSAGLRVYFMLQSGARRPGYCGPRLRRRGPCVAARPRRRSPSQMLFPVLVRVPRQEEAGRRPRRGRGLHGRRRRRRRVLGSGYVEGAAAAVHSRRGRRRGRGRHLDHASGAVRRRRPHLTTPPARARARRVRGAAARARPRPVAAEDRIQQRRPGLGGAGAAATGGGGAAANASRTAPAAAAAAVFDLAMTALIFASRSSIGIGCGAFSLIGRLFFWGGEDCCPLPVLGPSGDACSTLGSPGNCPHLATNAKNWRKLFQCLKDASGTFARAAFAGISRPWHERKDEQIFYR